MSKRLLPRAAMENLLKKAGAERVAEDAKDALKEILEHQAERISKHAITLALHAGRKTVKGSDVRLAAK
ncbi:NFYB/HAP3 family transcription factor subunit [Candidatus Woesearchaeota archaeon]|nr:NFYB/HAP3 family transcription factor subunit [Candidatus Woesearchaeota archaeon]